MPPARALYDPAALRTLEARAGQALGDPFELMRRAGQAAWREVLAHWPHAQPLVVVCGPGNNGGDGYLLALHARQAGREVSVVRLPEHAPRGPLAQRACAGYVAEGGAVVEFAGGLPPAGLLVDALFGIGLDRPLAGSAAGLVEAINAHPAPVLALDVPSGVDARSGAAGVAVDADRTLEFIAPKAGLRTGAALDRTGALGLAPLDLDASLYADVPAAAESLQPSDLARWLRPRPRDTHKGRNGRVLCIGGDHGRGGAILLAAEAALRCGAGLVEVLTRAPHVQPLLTRLPEAMAHASPDGDAGVAPAVLDAADVIAIGPGLGRAPWGRVLLQRALATRKPLVLDADALNLLDAHTAPLPAGCVLTPHPGEAARLLGYDTASVQADRQHALWALVDRFDAAVILKGAGSLVAAPGTPVQLIEAGNPGMATGGMGDVLTGVVAALLGQGLAPADAAACAALLHATAGDFAAGGGGQRGLLPSDLMPWLRRLANPETHA